MESPAPETPSPVPPSATPAPSSAPGSSPASDPTRRRVGSYELERELGEGPNGTVHEARDTSTGARVALKLLHDQPLDARARGRLRRAVRVQAQLEHPALAKLLATGEEGQETWVASRVVAGTPLRKRLAAGPLPVVAALELVAKLASIVGHAHEAGLAHAGLKPENVLVDEAGEVAVTDPGLQRALGLDSPDPTAAAYLAPEQARGVDALVDARTDVWALGAILHEALAGRPAFAGAVVTEVLAAIRDREPAELPGRDPREHDAATIVLRCLEKDPAHRYGDAGELAHDCRRALRAEPLLAARPGSLERRWRRLVRRPARLAATAAVFAGLALALGVAWLLARADRDLALADRRALLLDREADASARAARDAATEKAARDLQVRALRAELEGAVASQTPPEDVRAEAQALVALDGSPGALVRAGDLLAAAGLATDAEALYTRAAASADAHEAAAALLALATSLERRGEDATATYRALVAKAGAGEDDASVLAGRAALEPDASRALELLSRAVERDRRSAGLHVRRALARERTGAVDAALADLDAAGELAPRLAVVPLERARLLTARGEATRALGEAERALVLAPRSARAYLERARVRRALGLARDARSDVERAIGLRPELAAAFVLRGELARDAHDGASALADLDRAVELASRDPYVRAARARFRLAQDDANGALADSEAAVAAAPDRPEPLACRAAVLEKRGDHAGARRDLERAIQLWGPLAPRDVREALHRLER